MRRSAYEVAVVLPHQTQAEPRHISRDTLQRRLAFNIRHAIRSVEAGRGLSLVTRSASNQLRTVEAHGSRPHGKRKATAELRQQYEQANASRAGNGRAESGDQQWTPCFFHLANIFGLIPCHRARVLMLFWLCCIAHGSPLALWRSSVEPAPLCLLLDLGKACTLKRRD